ncbi:MAG: glycosyltransferase 87 family protein [Candidatus Hodarchaeota archaeon]
MKEELDNHKFGLTYHEILYLIILLVITLFLHILFYLQAIWPGDIDLFRFVERSTYVLEGKIPYSDKELLTDPKPFWTLFLAFWLFFCRTAIQILFKVEDSASYDLDFTKILLISINLIMIVTLFFASKHMLSPKSAYLTSGFYAINLFPLIICSVVGKYDVIPALFTLIAVWMVTKAKFRLSALFLAIGTLFKYLVILPLPILLIFLWKRERDQKLLTNYLTTYLVTCFIVLSPFLFINAQKFLSATVYYFLIRESHGYKSYYHPFHYIPSQFHILFPLISLSLICIYTLKQDSISNSDLIMLLFMEYATFTFTNKVFLSQYFLYAIPFLALVFPSMLLNENKFNFSFTSISLAISTIIIPNFLSHSFLKFFISVQNASFNDFKLSELLNISTSFSYIGDTDGRVFLICFTLILCISFYYVLKKQNNLRFTNLHKNPYDSS